MFRKSSHWIGLAVLSVLATVDRVVTRVRDVVVMAFQLGLDLFSTTPQVARPVVSFVQAKQFKQRIAKRERVLVSSSWRMCPST